MRKRIGTSMLHTLAAIVALSIVAGGAPALRDLERVDELKALFNHDRGKTRLVLLLSPT
jgi:hypothetical protein